MLQLWLSGLYPADQGSRSVVTNRSRWWLKEQHPAEIAVMRQKSHIPHDVRLFVMRRCKTLKGLLSFFMSLTFAALFRQQLKTFQFEQSYP